MRKIKNYCIFNIKGLNLERFFNELSKMCYVFEINRYEKNKVSFKVPLNRFKMVKNKILSSGYEILGQSRRGMLYNIFSLRKRVGLLAAIFLFVAIYAFQYSFVLQIKIDGVSERLKGEICEYIETNFSKNKSDLDCKQVEIKVREEFDELSFASVAIIGQTLVINAKEKENPIEKEGTFEPIVSSYDCKILELQLVQGTLAVGVGDVVQKGEIIVFPYITDTNGERRDVMPKANILIEQWHQERVEHYENRVERERTGKVETKNEVFLFGQKIYSSGDGCSFQEYDSEESEMCFSKNNLLPFFYKKTTYFEVTYIERHEVYEDVRENKIDEARQKALQKCDEYEIIKNERYEEKFSGGVYSIIYTITTNKEIIFKWKYIQNQKIGF